MQVSRMRINQLRLVLEPLLMLACIAGGTYFAPESAYGRPGFKTVLNRVSEAWQTQKGALLEQGAEVMKAIADAVSAEGTSPQFYQLHNLFRFRFGGQLLCIFFVQLRLLDPKFQSRGFQSVLLRLLLRYFPLNSQRYRRARSRDEAGLEDPVLQSPSDLATLMPRLQMAP